jgi:hypothetical protein
MPMNEKIAACGFRCDLCPAFRENVTGREHQQETSNGWFRYYGFRVAAEAIFCDGCLTEDSADPRRIDRDCEVRPCVLQRGLPNCAHCDEYVCSLLEEKIVDPEQVIKRTGRTVPQEDFGRFIKPYDNRTVLDRIREDIGKSPGRSNGE